MAGHPTELRCETANISTDGAMLCKLPAVVSAGDQIEYVLELPSQRGTAPVRVQCFGRVVHQDDRGTGVTIERYHLGRLAKGGIDLDAKQMRPPQLGET